MTILNLAAYVRRRLIVVYLTAVAYFRMSYFDIRSATTERKKGIVSMETVHQCINYVTTALAECALNGLQFISKDEKIVFLHLLIVYNAARIPESLNHHEQETLKLYRYAMSCL